LELTCDDIVILLGSGGRVLRVPDKTTRENRKIDRSGLESFSSIDRVDSGLPERRSCERERSVLMRYQLGLCVLACFLTGQGLFGQQPGAPLAVPAGMKSYYLVFIMAEGDAKRMVTSPEGKALFAEHRAFVRGNLEARKYLLAGPVTDASPLSGFAVAAARDEAQAREWEADDPLVKSGKFHFEVHPVLLQSLDVLKYESPK
jgi:uncharacterized protein YciI